MSEGANAAKGKVFSNSELVFLSLSFYWGAVLLMKFGFMSPSGAFGFAGQGIVGSLGLLTALVMIGAAPSLASGGRARKVIAIFSCASSFAVGAAVVLENLSGGGVLFFPESVRVLVRFLSTFGIGLSLAQAGSALAFIPKKNAAKGVAGSYCFGVLVSLGALSMDPMLGAVIYVLFSWISAVTALAIQRKEPHKAPAALPEDSAGSKKPFFVSAISSMPKTFWSIFLGLFFYSMVYGISLSIQGIALSSVTVLFPTNFLLLIAAVAMVFVLLQDDSKLNLPLFQWFLFVPIMIGLLPLSAVSDEGAVICCAILIISFTCYDVANIAILSDASRGLPWKISLRVFVWGRAANALGMAVGDAVMLPYSAAGCGYDDLPLAPVAFFAVIAMIVGMVYLGKAAFANKTLRQEQHVSGRWKKACEELGREHGVSPRELEVLFFTAKGRSTEWIAEKLFVSQSTVKTHAYRIYQKLGVHSQQELMNLVEERVEELRHTETT